MTGWIHVGTSGWHYIRWYPEEQPAEGMPGFCAACSDMCLADMLQQGE